MAYHTTGDLGRQLAQPGMHQWAGTKHKFPLHSCQYFSIAVLACYWLIHRAKPWVVFLGKIVSI